MRGPGRAPEERLAGGELPRLPRRDQGGRSRGPFSEAARRVGRPRDKRTGRIPRLSRMGGGRPFHGAFALGAPRGGDRSCYVGDGPVEAARDIDRGRSGAKGLLRGRRGCGDRGEKVRRHRRRRRRLRLRPDPRGEKRRHHHNEGRGATVHGPSRREVRRQPFDREAMRRRGKGNRGE